MRGITHAAIAVWDPAAVVVDLSTLEYAWGDEMTPGGWNFAIWVMFDWRACPWAMAAARDVAIAVVFIIPIPQRAVCMPNLPEGGFTPTLI